MTYRLLRFDSQYLSRALRDAGVSQACESKLTKFLRPNNFSKQPTDQSFNSRQFCRHGALIGFDLTARGAEYFKLLYEAVER